MCGANPSNSKQERSRVHQNWLSQAPLPSDTPPGRRPSSVGTAVLNQIALLRPLIRTGARRNPATCGTNRSNWKRRFDSLCTKLDMPACARGSGQPACCAAPPGPALPPIATPLPPRSHRHSPARIFTVSNVRIFTVQPCLPERIPFRFAPVAGHLIRSPFSGP